MPFHFFNLKPFRKFLIYAAAFVALILSLAVITGFLLKDKIINRFVQEANKRLATPVKIGKMDISLLSSFPDMSIELQDVYVEDSHPEAFPLFTANKVSLSFNAYEAWNEKYIIQGLSVTNSETNIRFDKKGKGNFQVLKDTAGSGQSISLDLRNIRLKKQRVTYADESAGQNHEFNSRSLAADVLLKDNLYSISVSGDVAVDQIGIGNNIFFRGKSFDVQASLKYDDKKKEVAFLPSSVNQGLSEFEFTGRYNFARKPVIDLVVNGQNTSLQSIISFFPVSMASAVEQYKSEGELYFRLGVKGEMVSPVIDIGFGCKNATIYHPETNFKITGANLTGTFSSVGLADFREASVRLQQMSGQLNGKDFTGDFDLKNFEYPFVNFRFKGEVEAETIKPFLDQELFSGASGSVLANISLQGELEKLKDRNTAQQVKISGAIEMKDVSLATRIKDVHLEGLNGTFQFTHNDLAMSDVKGRLGHSDFLLNGFFKNIVSYLLFEDQPIGVETDLRSGFLDIDELLNLGFGQSASNEYLFSISPNIHLNFDCQVARLKYKKFKAEDVTGNLLVNNQTAHSKEIKLKTMGGKITLRGMIEARDNRPIVLSTTAKVSSINIDSLFYVFGNFNQDFIQDRHLKGLATADINLQTEFTPALRIVPNSLISDMEILIKKGELNDFEPIQELSKYLDDDGLKRLRFADLKNEIHIENQTILIPLMEVRSNVTTFQLSGHHTFDQHIDYRIVAPLRNKQKINMEQVGNAFEKDIEGRIKLYFKITGTTDKYDVAYDSDALKKKIASDMKKELSELKDAFKDKKKKKELELQKDDYFDWDN